MKQWIVRDSSDKIYLVSAPDAEGVYRSMGLFFGLGVEHLDLGNVDIDMSEIKPQEYPGVVEVVNFDNEEGT